MANPSLKLRQGTSGEGFLGSTPGHVLTIDADGESVVPAPGGGGSGVATFNGRGGAVISQDTDYNSTDIADASNVGGPFVFDSFNTLFAQLQLTIPISGNITVATPALVAGTLGYVDVDLSLSIFAPVTVGSRLIASPNADLVPAGATQGYYIGLRVSSLNTARLTFVGTLPGGGVPFLFTKF